MDPACEAHFAQLAQDALAAHLHRNAVFLAERLHASNPTESNTHLLATAYLRNQQPQRAHAVLKGASPKAGLPHPGSRDEPGTCSLPCRYLRAVACLELALLPEAEAALSPAQDGEARARRDMLAALTYTLPLQIPGGSAGRFLLGVICRKTTRPVNAAEHFRQALAADPFCWAAFEELCALGEERSATHLLATAECAPCGACWRPPDAPLPARSRSTRPCSLRGTTRRAS